ncbi:MAG: hypothetical protein WC044_03440 [Crocinitomicaceae bacterium]
MGLILIYAVLLAACKGGNQNSDEVKPKIPDEQLSLEELVIRKVESQLQIPATEKYTLSIHKGQFDSDDIEDALVLVNRKQFALDEAVRKNRVKNQENIGYTGNFNFFFYYDGAKNDISRPITITSSASVPLKINIENIQTESYKDFTIDYRIMESCYRNFYTISNGVPKLVFQWGVFDYEKSDSSKVTYFEYATGSYSLAKDILVYPGKMITPLPKNLNNDFDYKIEKDGDLQYLFFYNPNQGKYYTKKRD